MLRGYAGSGKSTLAQSWIAESPDNRMRTNRDDLRTSLFASEGVLSPDKELFITKIQRKTVESALLDGKDVIVDDTNLRLKFAREWANLAVQLGAEFEVIDHYVDAKECIRRNLMRAEAGGRFVPAEAILSQAKRFPYPWPKVEPTVAQKGTQGQWEPYEHVDGLPEILVVDLDGTLALNQGTRGWYDWFRVGEDVPNEYVVDLVNELKPNADHVVYMSGRDSVCREITQAWIDQHVNQSNPDDTDELFMRAAGDQRPDDVVKHELINNHLRGKYNIKYWIDDRPKVCRMLRAIGIPLLQVGTGEEF